MTHTSRFRAGLVLGAGAILATAVSIGCAGRSEPRSSAIKSAPLRPRLVIVTPHNDRIRGTFEEAFSAWHEQEYGSEVNIRWVSRGTPGCLAYIQDAAKNEELAFRRMVPDLMFGGGISDHQVLADKGFAAALSSPPPQEAGVPEQLMGVALRDKQGYWHATALTSFGIFCHRAALNARGLGEPALWSDLAKPEYFGWLAIADPTRSGSTRFCMNIILQRYGWEQGWGLLMRTLANARTLLPSSDQAIESVSAGLCLAGMSVNFNAQHQAATQGGDKLAFISPSDAPTMTPDLMTLLNYASTPELAERFVHFCLSEQGQSLWSLRIDPDDEQSQPTAMNYYGHPLYRYPIVPSMYDRHADRLSVEGNPFEQHSDFVMDMALELQQSRLVPPLVLAAAGGENHVLLQRAWKAVIDAGLNSAALAELTKPLFDEQTAYTLGQKYAQDGDQAEKMAAQWAAQFRSKYQNVLKAAGG